MRLTVRRISGNLTKEANPIEEYKSVKSTWEISKQIADRLEDYAPQTYPHSERVQTVRAFNDILQGRSDRAISSLLDEVKRTLGEDGASASAEIAESVNAFLAQRRMLAVPYAKRGNKQYPYDTFDLDPEHPLKMVDQQIYDQAAKDGFPPDFFRDTFFNDVTFYCLPDHTVFRHSNLSGCTFAVCRVKEAMFEEARIYGSMFHSCPLEYVSFYKATLAHTRFHDCGLQNASFHEARLKSCNFFDCTMGGINFLNATIDGGGFASVDAYDIRNLHTATITQGGATHEEVNRLRMEIYAALRPESKERQPMPHKKRETR